MSKFADRVFTALGQFNGRLSALTEAVKSTPPAPPQFPKKTLEEVLKIADRARTAADAINFSFTLIEATALDIVDMQVRLQGETSRLASALRELGQAVERQPFVRQKFGDQLFALDEAAQLVAAAVFPGAVQGLNKVNVRLWDFEKIQWKRYTDTLSEIVRLGSISPAQEVRIQEIADGVARAFAEVNTLLNDLADTRASDAIALRRRLEQAPTRLNTALGKAGERLAQASKELAPFGPVIRDSAAVAKDVAALLKKLSVPVFPDHAGLGACCDFVDADLYEGLSGVQAFALLNILSALQATKASGRPLLDGRRPRVMQVLPARIYIEVDKAIIDDITADTKSFAPAPAALHKFKEGSFKQRTFKTGNLQFSYATRPQNRVIIDADIDLYRSTLAHLFGEVLVNHLTGNTTDQFTVRRMLDDRNVDTIGKFQLLTV